MSEEGINIYLIYNCRRFSNTWYPNLGGLIQGDFTNLSFLKGCDKETLRSLLVHFNIFIFIFLEKLSIRANVWRLTYF